MPVLPLATPRLTLRVMHSSDAAALAAYRADPEVARYQDWDLPYTEADAQRTLAPQDVLDDLDPEGWTQVAIEHDGEVVGDVAVGLQPERGAAALGYTLARSAQGRGFAVEAAGAVVDALFEHTGVHRIVATLDDANLASMRVIESLGFRFEGIARKAERIRGEWVDDARFSLLRDERAAWLARDLSPPTRVELVELAHETSRAYADLATHRYQEEFVAPMAASFRHALLPEMVDGARVVPWFRGITADGEPVGFIMTAEVTPDFPEPYLWRLLVDRRHQRRGIGRRAMEQLVDRLRAEGHRRLTTSWVPGTGTPEPFYRGLGFVPTGNLVDGEIEGALDL